MRTHSAVIITDITIGVLTAVLGLTGCGSKDDSADTAKKNGAQLEVGNTISYGSFGSNTEVDCGHGKSLNVGGSNNTLTVKGSCDTVNVLGADNKITLNKVDKSLTITGFNNTVTYRGGDPQVDDHGSGNTVKKS